VTSVRSEDAVGSVAQALDHAAKLLERDPALAEAQAVEVLAVVPSHPVAALLLGAARRAQGNAAGALAVLSALAAREPRSAATQLELGLALGATGRGSEAIAALRRAVQLKPELAEAWRALGDHALAIGDTRAADEAYARHLQFSARDPRLVEAALALLDNRLAQAETLLRAHLSDNPTDVAAIRMLAELASRLGRYGDAEQLLERCLELAPGFRAARHNYAFVLHRENKAAQALAEIERLLATEPRNPSYRNLQAAILVRIGEIDRAIELYAALLAEYPSHAKAWLSYGHSIKTAGRQAAAIEAYRKSLELQPELGEAWWSLANLKTVRFTDADVVRMSAQLERAALSTEDRFHLHFALGKALEDAARYAESFDHYAQGNALRRSLIRYDAQETTEQVRRSKELFTREFFADRARRGAGATDPIFIVGLPRSGSTLLEQILASHPLVEGTQELPDIPAMARRLGVGKVRTGTKPYPQALADLDADELCALGEQYLQQTRIQRKTDRPFFIDKMPNNWAHVGLIHLMLPNAKVVDARRHPLGCCFSGFKQHFARGQHFTYDLMDIGRYYRDYVDLMAHFDTILPGRVHRVIYESMVEDTEAEVRRLLEYCGLPFDARCLEFHRTERAVRTASSEQVRRPIFREAVEQWKNFEPWLGPLREALGPVLERYPDVPVH
jgi:tetratricopeptide (TPR) repeat protein